MSKRSIHIDMHACRDFIVTYLFINKDPLLIHKWFYYCSNIGQFTKITFSLLGFFYILSKN